MNPRIAAVVFIAVACIARVNCFRTWRSNCNTYDLYEDQSTGTWKDVLQHQTYKKLAEFYPGDRVVVLQNYGEQPVVLTSSEAIDFNEDHFAHEKGGWADSTSTVWEDENNHLVGSTRTKYKREGNRWLKEITTSGLGTNTERTVPFNFFVRLSKFAAGVVFTLQSQTQSTWVLSNIFYEDATSGPINLRAGIWDIKCQRALPEEELHKRQQKVGDAVSQVTKDMIDKYLSFDQRAIIQVGSQTDGIRIDREPVSTWGSLHWTHRYEVFAVRTNTKDSDTLAQVKVPYTDDIFRNYANVSPRAVRKGLVESFLQEGQIITLESESPGHDEHR